MHLRFGFLATAFALLVFSVNGCETTTSNTDADASNGSSSGDPAKDGGGGADGSSGGTDGESSDAPAGDSSTSCGDPTKKICDAFDQGTTIAAQWTPVANGGTVSIVAEGTSAPNALAITIDANSGGAVYLEKEFAYTTKVHCELDMKIVTMPSQGDLDIFSITTKTAQGDYYVYFAHNAAGYHFSEYSDNVDNKQTITAPPTGTWFHVVLDNDGTSATFTANGASATQTGLAMPAGTSRNLQIGAPFSQGTDTNSRVLYDNVVCTFGN